MAAKVSEKEYKRILELKALGLTDAIIAERMGITSRTVRVYTRSARLGVKPYAKSKKEQADLPSNDHTETPGQDS